MHRGECGVSSEFLSYYVYSTVLSRDSVLPGIHDALR